VTSSTAVPVRRLWVAVLCGYLALGATLQALPTFVPLRFGGGALASGTAVGVAFFTTALTRPFAGRFADAGRARPVVMLGGVLGALGGLGHLWAPNFSVLIVARLVMGAGEAALFSGALPWVLANAPTTRRGRVAGWFGLSMWGGLAAGPLLAAVLAVSGFTAVWTAVVMLGLISTALVFSTHGQPASISEISLLPQRWSDVVPSGASLPGLVFGLSSYGYGTVAALLVLHLRTDAIGAETYALAVFAAAFLLNRAASSPAVDRFGGRTVAAVSVLIEATGLVLIGIAHNFALALLGVVLAGAGVALMYPSTVAITLDRAGALRPGTSVGVMTSFWDVGILVAGPLGGAIAAGSTYPLAFLVAAANSLLSLAIIMTMLRSRTRGKASEKPAGQSVPPALAPSPPTHS
jgi:MFS family permease